MKAKRSDHVHLDIESVIDQNDNIDAEALEALFARLLVERGEDVLAELGIEIEVALQNAVATRFIQRSAHEVLDQVNGTTGRTLRDEFAAIAEKGGTYADYVEAVHWVFDGRRNNAANIARTETTGAYNFASINAAKESGVVVGKVWLTAEDELVRDSHAAAELQGQIGIDESWVLDSSEGPVSMSHPGDPDAPPDLVCNCRCTMMFVTAEDPVAGQAAKPATKAMRDWFDTKR